MFNSKILLASAVMMSLLTILLSLAAVEGEKLVRVNKSVVVDSTILGELLFRQISEDGLVLYEIRRGHRDLLDVIVDGSFAYAVKGNWVVEVVLLGSDISITTAVSKGERRQDMLWHNAKLLYTSPVGGCEQCAFGRNGSWAVVNKDGEKYSVIVNGASNGEYDFVPRKPAFSSDGSRVLFMAKRDAGWYIVDGESEYGPHVYAGFFEFGDKLGVSYFQPHYYGSEQWPVYVFNNGGGYFVRCNDKIVGPLDISPTLEDVYINESGVMFCSGIKDGKAVLLCKDEVLLVGPRVVYVSMSRDGKRWAAITGNRSFGWGGAEDKEAFVGGRPLAKDFEEFFRVCCEASEESDALFVDGKKVDDGVTYVDYMEDSSEFVYQVCAADREVLGIKCTTCKLGLISSRLPERMKYYSIQDRAVASRVFMGTGEKKVSVIEAAARDAGFSGNIGKIVDSWYDPEGRMYIVESSSDKKRIGVNGQWSQSYDVLMLTGEGRWGNVSYNPYRLCLPSHVWKGPRTLLRQSLSTRVEYVAIDGRDVMWCEIDQALK